MNVVKLLGMILLAVFLILTGVSELADVGQAPLAKYTIDLVGLAAGVLLLVSLGRFLPHHNKR